VLLYDYLSLHIIASKQFRRNYPPSIDISKLAYESLKQVADYVAGIAVTRKDCADISLEELLEPSNANFIQPNFVVNPKLREILSTAGIKSWDEIAPKSVQEILSIDYLGKNKCKQIISELMFSVLKSVRDSAPVPVSGNPTKEAEDEKFLGNLASSLNGVPIDETQDKNVNRDQFDQALNRLIDWAWVSGIKNVEELFARLNEEEQSEPIRKFRQSVDSISIRELSNRNDSYGGYLNNSFNDIASTLNEMENGILTLRLLANDPLTLVELGEKFDVTRERIRQVESSVRERVSLYLASETDPMVLWLFDLVIDKLGSCFFKDHEYTNQLEEKYFGGVDPENIEPIESLLFKLYGGYEEEDGWYFKKSSISESPVGKTFTEELFAQDEMIEFEKVSEQCRNLGMQEVFVSEAIKQNGHIKQIGTCLVRWDGSLTDKCVAVLTLSGQPMSLDAISEMAGEPLTARGISSRLSEDERVKRVTKSKWDLRSSSNKEYKGIVPSMIDYLVEQKNPVSTDKLVSYMAETYETNETSSRLYLDAPVFSISNGYVSLRDDLKTFPVSTDFSRVKNVKLLGEHEFEYTIDVDEELLSGSGRGFPVQCAGKLGMFPGDSRTYIAGDLKVEISWNPNSLYNAQMSSLGKFASANDLEIGDKIRFGFNVANDEIQVSFGKPKETSMVPEKSQIQKQPSIQSETNGESGSLAIDIPITGTIVEGGTTEISADYATYFGIKKGQTQKFSTGRFEFEISWHDNQELLNIDTLRPIVLGSLCSVGSIMEFTFGKGNDPVKVKEVTASRARHQREKISN